MSELLKIRSEDLCQVKCPFFKLLNPSFTFFVNVGSMSCSECESNAGIYIHRKHEHRNIHHFKIHNEEKGVYTICLKKAHNHSRKVLIEKTHEGKLCF